MKLVIKKVILWCMGNQSSRYVQTVLFTDTAITKCFTQKDLLI